LSAGEIAFPAARLPEPRLHDDPFDELLLLQAQLEGHKLLTRDAKLMCYSCAAAT
jgi:PIN domain nuclease of toxin-antitoxin system